MKVSEELQQRGFIYQCSDESVAKVFDGEKRVVYLGIDPTATAIHIGNLAPYMLLNHLLRAGHEVIILIGGATALIGDPSGRDNERDMVDVAEVSRRAIAMEANVRRFTSDTVRFVNNYDWLSKISLVEFLRDVGKHFTVNSLIKKDAIATRLSSEQGISYTEFSYNLLQSYDFYHLHQTQKCTVQIGGSDQWGNITGGIEYVRRMTGNTVYGITMPLITDKATGKKFGKSMGNAVWLDEELTSPYELYQFWLNVSDESVIDYLKLFTLLTLEEIAAINVLHSNNPADRLAQVKLAQEVVRFVHGQEKMVAASLATDVLFGAVSLKELNATEQDQLQRMVPSTIVSEATPLVEVLIAANLASSKREAREFIEGGAVTVNEILVKDANFMVTKNETGSFFMITRGKKQRGLVVIE